MTYTSDYTQLPVGDYDGQLIIGSSVCYPVKKFVIDTSGETIPLELDPKQMDTDESKGRERGREGGREGGMEGGRGGGRERRREGGRGGGREGEGERGRKGGREGGREGEREGCTCTCMQRSLT